MNASSDSFSAKTYPLRVLYISHEGGMYGAQQSLLLLLKQLPSNINVHVSLARPGPLEDELATMPAITVHHHQRVQWVKHTKRSLLQSIGDIAGMVWTSLWRVPKLAQLIRRHNITLVHTNSLVSLEGPLAAWLAGVPHVWHIREMPSIPNPRFQPLLPVWLVRWICQNLTIATGGKLLCISKAVRNQFTCSDDLASIIYNPFTLPDYTPAEPQGHTKTNVGYVGRISPGKGIIPLIHAIAQCNQQAGQPPVTLHCFGKFVDANAEVEIRQLVHTLSVDDRVIFHGFCTNKADMYAHMDILALPSTNEAFGRVLIEAMAHGKPCIGSNAAAIPEVITPILGPHYLFKPDNPAHIAATIRHALTDTNQPSTGALRAYCTAFSETHHAKGVLALYKAIS